MLEIFVVTAFKIAYQTLNTMTKLDSPTESKMQEIKPLLLECNIGIQYRFLDKLLLLFQKFISLFLPGI